MTEKDIKPIPKYILEKIKKFSAPVNDYNDQIFCAYYDKIKGELVKVTVACKHYKRQWFCKQVAVHGIHSTHCFVKDMQYAYMGGYSVGWFYQGIDKCHANYEDGNWYKAEDKYFDPYAEVINKTFPLKFDAYKYSAVDKYKHIDVFKYLRLYEQYPNAEYFVKMGLDRLATSKTLLRKTAKDKAFRKWLIQYAKILRNADGAYPFFSVQELLDIYKEGLNLTDGHALCLERKLLMQNYTFRNRLSKIIRKNETYKFLQYLKKQNTNISTYYDYISACTYLGLDINKPKNRYPHDFKRWHDIRIDQYHTAKAMKDAEERKELYAKFARIAEKYLPLQRNKEDTFIVVIAKSPQNLIREGTWLHHCVGSMNYDQRFVKEESLIFFVRNANDPNTPFVTMEYSIKGKQILQCHAENNRKPSDNVMEFINQKWLPYANRKLKKIAA